MVEEEEGWYFVLYTSQKTQKRKTWHDGRAQIKKCKLSLYEEESASESKQLPIYSCSLSQDSTKLHPGQELEFGPFLLQVQEKCAPNTNNSRLDLEPIGSEKETLEEVLSELEQCDWVVTYTSDLKKKSKKWYVRFSLF
jgi:hypothetical protein